MKTALYIGNHAGESWLVKLATAIIRLGQKGELGVVSHVEMILDEFNDGSVLIASSSLREGGVRTKRVTLKQGNWMIVDVPLWDVSTSRIWFETHQGQPYDSRGALATLLPGHQDKEAWFCNEACGASVGLVNPGNFGPHQFAAIALTFGSDVTEEFFKDAK